MYLMEFYFTYIYNTRWVLRLLILWTHGSHAHEPRCSPLQHASQRITPSRCQHCLALAKTHFHLFGCSFMGNYAKKGSGGAVLLMNAFEAEKSYFGARWNSTAIESCNFTDSSAGKSQCSCCLLVHVAGPYGGSH